MHMGPLLVAMHMADNFLGMGTEDLHGAGCAKIMCLPDAGHTLEGRMEIEATMYSCKTKCEFISQMNCFSQNQDRAFVGRIILDKAQVESWKKHKRTKWFLSHHSPPCAL